MRGYRVNRARVDSLVHHDDEVTPRRVTKAARMAGAPADALLHRIVKNLFDVFGGQPVLGNVLDVALRLVFLVPDDLYEPNPRTGPCYNSTVLR